MNELKTQTEKLLDENLALKKQIHDLQIRIDELSRKESEIANIKVEHEKTVVEYEKRITIITEEYEKKIIEITTKYNELEGKSMDKGKYKEIIKQINTDINERNNFYDDERKRIRDDKNANTKKFKA